MDDKAFADRAARRRQKREQELAAAQAARGGTAAPPTDGALEIEDRHLKGIDFLARLTGQPHSIVLNEMLSIAGTFLNLMKGSLPIIMAMVRAEAARGQAPPTVPMQPEPPEPETTDEPPVCPSCRGFGVIRTSATSTIDCPSCKTPPAAEEGKP